MELTSQVIITSQIEKTIVALEGLRQDETLIEFISPSMHKILTPEEDVAVPAGVQRVVTEKETFRVEDAKAVLDKAYLASEEKNIIILAADAFTAVIQNRLLKVIEEPPKNKIFILITANKSTVLDTIKSRLPIKVLSEKSEEVDLGLDVKQLSLATVYEFTQSHKRTDVRTMKGLVERIAKEAVKSGMYDLDEKTLTLFSNAYKALDVGSPAQFVLNTVLLKLLARKKR
jgi:DNA polymerase-3 subunit delta'